MLSSRLVLDPERDFEAKFRRAAGYVRLRLGVHHVLSALGVGSAVAAITLGACVLAHQPKLRALAFLPLVVSAVAGAVIAKRKRLGDEDLALLLDARLLSHEAITTAEGSLAARNDSAPNADDPHRTSVDPVTQVLLTRASSILERAPKATFRVPVLAKFHALIPLSLVACVLIARVRPPAEPISPKAPGTEVAEATDVQGLAEVVRLRTLDARDEAQRERLEKLAAEAQRIQKKLREGASQREVKADVAKLQGDVAAEKMSLGTGVERKGLEAAIAALGKNGEVGGAARALGDHDLTAFDTEMQRAANLAEKHARDRAKEGLQEAEDAAAQSGAKGVAQMLAEQRKRFAEQEKEASQLRDLARSMGDSLGKDGAKALGDLDKTGDPDAARRLASAMGKALEKLTPLERKALAKRMEDLAKQGASGDPERSRDLSKELDSSEGMQSLEAELRAMANAQPDSSEARREQALGAAEQKLGGASRGPGAGDASASGGTGLHGGSGSPGGDGGPSASRKNDAPPTAKLDAKELRAHAETELGAGVPMPGMVKGRSSARPGETANTRGVGALGDAASDEVGGVDRSEVPEEYRDQVGRYFQP